METTTTPEMLGYYDGNTWKTFTLEDLSKPENLMTVLNDIIHKRTHDRTYMITKSPPRYTYRVPPNPPRNMERFPRVSTSSNTQDRDDFDWSMYDYEDIYH